MSDDALHISRRVHEGAGYVVIQYGEHGAQIGLALEDARGVLAYLEERTAARGDAAIAVACSTIYLTRELTPHVRNAFLGEIRALERELAH